MLRKGNGKKVNSLLLRHGCSVKINKHEGNNCVDVVYTKCDVDVFIEEYTSLHYNSFYFWYLPWLYRIWKCDKRLTWFEVDFPNKKLFSSAIESLSPDRINVCMAAMFKFSLPQSLRIIRAVPITKNSGHKWYGWKKKILSPFLAHFYSLASKKTTQKTLPKLAKLFMGERYNGMHYTLCDTHWL